MADLHERIAQLEVRADERDNDFEKTCIREDNLLEKLSELNVIFSSLKTTVESSNDKIDGINTRLDRLNGSVAEIKMNKVDKPDFENTVKLVSEQVGLLAKNKADLKWAILIGGFLAILLIGHLGWNTDVSSSLTKTSTTSTTTTDKK